MKKNPKFMTLNVHSISNNHAFSKTFILKPSVSSTTSRSFPTDGLNNYFIPQYLRENNLIIKTAKGRGAVYFFNLHERKFALRHYFRGGMVGKVLTDQFFYSGLKTTRSYKELGVLTHLLANDICVPKPLAARVITNGIIYRSDIITHLISGAYELHALLMKDVVKDEVWHYIGIELRKLHNAQVCHYDINVKNILVKDDNSIVLLDFDSAEIKSSNGWKQDNLARLNRSLNKQKTKLNGYHYQPSNWNILIEAYKNYSS